MKGACRTFAVAAGAPAPALTAPGEAAILALGERRPVCREKNEQCRARNRRAHFLVKVP